MEQIYTIPVNEKFDESRADRSCGCPLCSLARMLEENELDLILGASMMEPDIRIKTNKEGFCGLHYNMMFGRKNRLGMALTLQSHLNELSGEIKNGGFMKPSDGSKPIKRISQLEDSCYVCNKINFHFRHMTETVVYLWDTDESFREKFREQPYFCLPHYRMLLEQAQHRLGKKKVPEFASEASGIVEAYMSTLKNDIDWFCKKFDYRYDAEPWYNSRDSVERAMKFLRSDVHNINITNRKPEQRQ